MTLSNVPNSHRQTCTSAPKHPIALIDSRHLVFPVVVVVVVAVADRTLSHWTVSQEKIRSERETDREANG